MYFKGICQYYTDLQLIFKIIHTFSHRYGWYSDISLEGNREDRRLHFPRRITELVKVKSLIDHAASVTKPRG